MLLYRHTQEVLMSSVSGQMASAGIVFQVNYGEDKISVKIHGHKAVNIQYQTQAREYRTRVSDKVLTLDDDPLKHKVDRSILERALGKICAQQVLDAAKGSSKYNQIKQALKKVEGELIDKIHEELGTTKTFSFEKQQAKLQGIVSAYLTSKGISLSQPSAPLLSSAGIFAASSCPRTCRQKEIFERHSTNCALS